MVYKTLIILKKYIKKNNISPLPTVAPTPQRQLLETL